MNHHAAPTPPPSDSPQDLLAAYSIGATDPAETQAVRDYLNHKPADRQEVNEYTAAAALLLSGVPMRQPSPALRQKLLDAARAVTPVTPPKRLVRPRSWFVAWAASAAAVVLLVMNGIWLSQLSALSARQAQLETLTQNQQIQMAALEAANHELMNKAMTIMVTGTKAELMDDSGEMRAMVMWQPGHSEAVMFTHSLPSLDETRTYQLWLIDEQDQMISAGTFSVDAEGRATLMFNAQAALDAFDGFGISVEPMGGSVTPTSKPLAVAGL
jgi:anti-sigma-K factor RskA